MSWIVFFVFLFSGLRFVRFLFMDHKMIGRLCLLSWRLVLVPSFWDGYKLLINFINFSVSVDACYVASVVSDSLWPLGRLPSRLLCPRNSPGKKTGVGYHDLLQGIFPTQGSNPCLFTSSALAGRYFTTSTTWEDQVFCIFSISPWIKFANSF